MTYGAGHTFGINLDKCFHEVQNFNMSKLDEDGKPIYNKRKSYEGAKLLEPNLQKVFKIMKDTFFLDTYRYLLSFIILFD